MAINSYKDLVVWNRSFGLTKDVYVLTSKLPNDEKFGLVSQMRRCAASIPSNIAEGQQRNNPGEYKHFLGIAKGSSAELETQLLLIKDIYGVDVGRVLDDLSEIQKTLGAMLRKL